MDIFIIVFGFLWGSVLASFFGSLTFRLITDKKLLLRKRSFCPECKHDLSAIDLVPIVSFVVTKGRCRYCRKKIPTRYLSGELVCGLMWSICAYGVWTNAAFWRTDFLVLGSALALVLTALVVVDVFYYILPHELNGLALLAVLALLRFELIPERLWAVIIAVGFFLALFVITRFKGIGFGDVILSVWFGYGLGVPVVVVGMMLSFIYGAVVGLIMMGFGKSKMKSALPFGPFLILGFVTAFFWGEKIVRWYVSML